jgi:hypothetical protein
MAYTFRGIGAMNYGKRDFRVDGSFVTTLWFVVFYVPVIPIHSKRIVSTGEIKYFALKRVPTVVVQEKTPPHGLQVLCVYAWFAAVLAPLITAKIEDNLWIALPALLILPLPWLLRKRAVDRIRAEVERQKLGLSPVLSD